MLFCLFELKVYNYNCLYKNYCIVNDFFQRVSKVQLAYLGRS